MPTTRGSSSSGASAADSQQEVGVSMDADPTPEAIDVDYPVGDLISSYANEGQPIHPNMAHVARVLFSVPASSAVLKREFSTAGRFITEARSRLTAAGDGDVPERKPSVLRVKCRPCHLSRRSRRYLAGFLTLRQS